MPLVIAASEPPRPGEQHCPPPPSAHPSPRMAAPGQAIGRRLFHQRRGWSFFRRQKYPVQHGMPAPLPAHFIPEPADVTGSCMLNLFQINEQAYWRTGSETRATSNGRTVRLVVWASDCPDCGAPFTQAHRDRGFVPTKSALRRCPACRNGPGKRVLGSCNGGSKFSSSTGRASLASAVATLA